MDVRFRYCKYDDVLPLKKRCTEQVDFTYNPSVVLLGAFVGDKIIGCTAWLLMGKNLRWKCDYVLPEYRGNGVFSALWKLRSAESERIQCEQITAYSTAVNVWRYRRDGFVVGEPNRNNVFYCKKILK